MVAGSDMFKLSTHGLRLIVHTLVPCTVVLQTLVQLVFAFGPRLLAAG